VKSVIGKGCSAWFVHLGWLANFLSNDFPLVGLVLLDRGEKSCTLPYDFSNGSVQILVRV
jgi:hypothetical protein